MREMIDTKLTLKVVHCASFGTCHDSSVCDKDVQLVGLATKVLHPSFDG